MKSTGIIRGVASLGRIVLPKELRNTLQLDTNTKLEIFVDGDTILLKKYHPAGACDFCGENVPGIINFGNCCICPACRRKIGSM